MKRWILRARSTCLIVLSLKTVQEMVRTTHGQLVLLGQLVHTKNGNDILERLVVLEDLLDSGGNLVVLGTDLWGSKIRSLGN